MTPLEGLEAAELVAESTGRLLATLDETRAALRKLVEEAEAWSVHAPDYCSRDEECDESNSEDPCLRHAPDLDGPQTDQCPACECGVSRLQAVVSAARKLLQEAPR